MEINASTVEEPQSIKNYSHHPDESTSPCISKYEAISNSIFQDNDFSKLTRNNLKYVTRCLKHKANEFMENKDFDSAEKCNNLTHYCYTYLSKSKIQAAQRAKSQEIESQIIALNAKSKEVHDKWLEVIQKIKETRDAELTRMKKYHSYEIEEFNELYKQERPPEFHKFSPKLIEMRSTQRALVLSKRYIQAITVKEEADLLQSKEEENQIKQFHHHLDSLKKAIIRCQNEKVAAREDFWKKELESAIHSMQDEMKHFQMTIDHLSKNREKLPQIKAPKNMSACSSPRTPTGYRRNEKSPRRRILK